MNQVKSQQKQIDELRAQVEALQAAIYGWSSVQECADRLGISASFIRGRLQRPEYQAVARRCGRKYVVHLGKFRQLLEAENG